MKDGYVLQCEVISLKPVDERAEDPFLALGQISSCYCAKSVPSIVQLAAAGLY